MREVGASWVDVLVVCGVRQRQRNVFFLLVFVFLFVVSCFVFRVSFCVQLFSCSFGGVVFLCSFCVSLLFHFRVGQWVVWVVKGGSKRARRMDEQG